MRMQDQNVQTAGQNYTAPDAYHASGSIRGIYEPGCELFRKRIECAIMMQVAKEMENEEQ